MAIDVRGLSRRFGSFVAVDNLSFSVKQGEIFGFLGANGAGKSTTIRMLCGLLRPSSGTALVGGIDVSRDPEGVKRRIGYMSQKFSLYEALTVDQNIRLLRRHLRPRAASGSRRGGSSCSRWPALQGRGNTLTRELPGGWRQRLALGCAILHEPSIVFLDEPTGGVDPLSRRRFWDLIGELSRQGVTVLVTTHYLDEAEHCHRIAIIHAGKLAAMGTASELKQVFASRPILEVHAVDARRGDDRARCDTRRSKRPACSAPRCTPCCERIDVHPDVLARRSSAKGIDVHSIGLVSPSLEDVFLDVVERVGARVMRKVMAVATKELRQILPRPADAAHPAVRAGVLPAALRLRAELRHSQRVGSR